MSGKAPVAEKEKSTDSSPSSPKQESDKNDSVRIQITKDDEKKQAEEPLLTQKEASVLNEIIDVIEKGGGDDSTLPLKDKKDTEDGEATKEKEDEIPSFHHPIDRLKYTWEHSANPVEFLFKAVGVIFCSVGWIILSGGVPFIAIAQIVIGAVYKDDCPVDKRIPIYQIVAGVCGVAKHVYPLCSAYGPQFIKDFLEKHKKRCMSLDGLLQIFLLIWFICGCVWVYGAYEPEYKNADQVNYCNKTLYLFSFWLFNIMFILIVAAIAAGICCCVCVVTAGYGICKMFERATEADE